MTTKTPTYNRNDQIKRGEKQIVECVLSHPFFATLLLGLQRTYEDTIDTMATDGVRLLINPKFVSTLEDAEIRGVLVHEAMHCALGHPWRKGNRDHQKSNIAMDYAINLEIDDYIKGGGKVALPSCGLLDQQYRGMAWEQIYAKLPDPPKGGQGSGNGSEGKGGMGEVLDGANPIDPQTGKPKTNEEMIADWKGKLVQAAQSARMQGNLPACMERLVNGIINPVVPWRQVLRRFFTDLVKSDYDWMRPDRRFLPDDIYIPDIGDEETAGEIVVAIDTSGSIDGDMITAFATELNAIHRDLKPSKVHVVYCDAAVAHVDEFGPDDKLTINPKGGGGTSFAPVFEWVEQNHLQPKALVYLTDLYGSHYQEVPPYPVLWACWSQCTDIPFGELITVKP